MVQLSKKLHFFAHLGVINLWDYKTNVPSDRQNFAVATFSGRLLVIGGWLHGPSAVVEAYDGSTWERMPDLLTPRSAAAASALFAEIIIAE